MAKLGLVTFDLDNTLWPIDEVISAAEAEWLEWLRVAHVKSHEALQVDLFRTRRQEVLTREPDLIHDLTALRIRTTEEAFVAFGLAKTEARQIAEAAFEVFHVARNRVTLFEGTLNVIRRLSERFVIGALTNGNADLGKIGIADYFDFHHSSESVGRRKPALDMFRAGLDSARMSPDRCVHVGDHPLEDVDAARRAGYHAVWFNRAQATWPSELELPAHTIQSLEDLIPLVERLFSKS